MAASTGPRSSERGKASCSGLRSATGKPASTGPRSSERGKLHEAIAKRTAAEALQRGRAHLSAERALQHTHILLVIEASTGPRSSERGKDSSPDPKLASRNCFNGAALI